MFQLTLSIFKSLSQLSLPSSGFSLQTLMLITLFFLLDILLFKLTHCPEQLS